MPFHIQDGGGAQLSGGESLVEFQGVDYLGHELVGDGLASAVIVGISGEDFLLEGPVLIELRECLDEIAGHVGAAHGLITALGEEAVKGVAELVEGRAHIVDGQHRRLLGGCRREVAAVHDDGTDVLAGSVHALLAEIVHPGASSLGLAGEVVAVEYAEQGTVCISQLICLDYRIIYLNLRSFLDLDAIDLRGREEDALADAVGGEVGLGEVLVKVIFAGAHLLGVVEPVPGLDAGACGKEAGGYVLVHNLLHIIDFLLGPLHRGGHNLGEELIDRGGIVGHFVVEDISG